MPAWAAAAKVARVLEQSEDGAAAGDAVVAGDPVVVVGADTVPVPAVCGALVPRSSEPVVVESLSEERHEDGAEVRVAPVPAAVYALLDG